MPLPTIVYMLVIQKQQEMQWQTLHGGDTDAADSAATSGEWLMLLHLKQPQHPSLLLQRQLPCPAAVSCCCCVL